MLLLLKLLILVFTFSSVWLVLSQLMPFITEKYFGLHRKKVKEAESRLDEMFISIPGKKLLLFYALSPIVFGIAGFIFFNQAPPAIVSAAIGFVVPALAIRVIAIKRKKKFQEQLLDALMILSSSLKSGLSFLQAIDVLVDEMPAPINQEFSLVLRENKMGASLEDSLVRLNKRMALEELELMINSILVARETGGDLTKVFNRLATTIRDNQKVKAHIKTLTLQGRIQGIVMSALPVLFAAWIGTTQKGHFDVMFTTELGRKLLYAAVFLQLIGVYLIYVFSRARV